MLKKFLSDKNNPELLKAVNAMHPRDIVNELEDLSEEEFNEILLLLDPSLAAEVLVYLEPSEAAEHIQEQNLETQIALLDAMDIDDAADIIEEFDEDQQDRVIHSLEDADQLEQLLKYDDNHAGAYMTTQMIVLKPEMGVKEATKKMIKEAPEVETIMTFYVVNDLFELIGKISLKHLISAKPPTTIRDLMEDVRSFHTTDEISEVTTYLRDYGYFVVPLVDDENKLVGMVTLDDAIEAYTDEASEDFTKLAATSSTEDTGFIKAAWHRLIWLLILVIVDVPLIFTTGLFEEIIASFAILAMFQPLILALAGNVATQTLAVTLLYLNDPDDNPQLEARREIGSGLLSGVLLGIVAGLSAYVIAIIIHSPFAWRVGLVVGVSLMGNIAISPAIGFAIPYFLKKIKLDPAAASGPLITSVVDFFAMIIYFGLATLLLGGIA